jgi:two-component system KDP operon response regulator KdpE
MDASSTRTTRILIVDDEIAIRRYLRAALSAQSYEVSEAATGKEALALVAMQPPDLVILDLGLPDLDGVTVTRQIRAWSLLPTLILSVRDHEKDKVAALDAGADDYLTKPFGTGELLARLRVALRRTAGSAVEEIFQYEGLQIDWSRRQVSVHGQEVSLTPTEFELLRTFVHHAGKVLTHQFLLKTIWGTNYESELHILRVNLSNLRRKIEPDPSRPRYILTEPGVGYRFRISVE